MYSVYAYFDLLDTTPALVYSPDKVEEGYVLTAGSFNAQVDQAGDATLTIPYSHPRYGDFKKLKTQIMIKRDDKIVWFGRVFGIRRDFYQNKVITCEGALAFLNDICLAPYQYWIQSGDYTANLVTLGALETELAELNTKRAAINEDEQPAAAKTLDKQIQAKGDEIETFKETHVLEEWTVQPKTKQEHLDYIIGVYNYRCSAARKVTFMVSNITLGTDANITGCDSYDTVFTEIQNRIVEDYNYSMIPSWSIDENGRVITNVELCQLPSGACTQKVEFAKNLIDFEEFISGDELYNNIIPLGSGNLNIYNDNGKDPLDSHVDLKDRQYYVQGGIEGDSGPIDKVINFDTIEDRDKLEQAALNIIQLGGGTGTMSFTIKAVDLSLLDVDIDKIELGQSMEVVSAPHNMDKTFVITQTSIDFLNPANNSYTFSEPGLMTPETMTQHFYSSEYAQNMAAGKKVTIGENYGMFYIVPDGVGVAFLM